MATDDERRRVAAALRRYVKTYACPTWRVLCGIVLGGDKLNTVRMIQTLDRLADLIEPAPKCSEATPKCDREALLDMEDEMFESATGLALISELEEDADLKDLQTTMAKVLFGYARRVREACGVVG